VPYDFELE